MSEFVYEPSMGVVFLDEPQTVVIAGRPREKIEWCYPGIVAHYEHWDRVEDSKRHRSSFEGVGDV